MTLQEFRTNEALVLSFAQCLKMPEVALAIQTIKDAYLPLSSEPPSGVSFEAWNSHQNTRREGFYEAIRLIELMGKPVARGRDKVNQNLMPSLVDEESYEPNTNAE